MPAAVTYFYKITKDKLTKVCMLTKCTQRKFHGHHLEQDETPTSQQLASTEKGAATMLQSIQDVLTFNAVVIQDSFSQCRCQPSNKQYSNSRCQCVTMEWSNLQPFFHPFWANSRKKQVPKAYKHVQLSTEIYSAHCNNSQSHHKVPRVFKMVLHSKNRTERTSTLVAVNSQWWPCN